MCSCMRERGRMVNRQNSNDYFTLPRGYKRRATENILIFFKIQYVSFTVRNKWIVVLMIFNVIYRCSSDVVARAGWWAAQAEHGQGLRGGAEGGDQVREPTLSLSLFLSLFFSLSFSLSLSLSLSPPSPLPPHQKI